MLQYIHSFNLGRITTRSFNSGLAAVVDAEVRWLLRYEVTEFKRLVELWDTLRWDSEVSVAHMFCLIQEVSSRLLLCINSISRVEILGSSIEILLSLECLNVSATDLLVSFVTKCNLVRGLVVLEDRRIVIGPCRQVCLGITSTIQLKYTASRSIRKRSEPCYEVRCAINEGSRRRSRLSNFLIIVRRRHCCCSVIHIMANRSIFPRKNAPWCNVSIKA